MFILIWLAVLLSCVTLYQKEKSIVKSIYFQKIKALKKKLKQTKKLKSNLNYFRNSLKYVLRET
jgi:hypothetical protein